MNTRKLKALLTLLDDPSDDVYSLVEEELLKEEVDVVTELERAWEVSGDNLFQERVENVIHHLQLKDVKKLIKESPF